MRTGALYNRTWVKPLGHELVSNKLPHFFVQPKYLDRSASNRGQAADSDTKWHGATEC